MIDRIKYVSISRPGGRPLILVDASEVSLLLSRVIVALRNDARNRNKSGNGNGDEVTISDVSDRLKGVTLDILSVAGQTGPHVLRVPEYLYVLAPPYVRQLMRGESPDP